MATYDYDCSTCRLVREVTKPISRSADPERCYRCGSLMKRVFSTPPAITFKGKGWGKDKS